MVAKEAMDRTSCPPPRLVPTPRALDRGRVAVPYHKTWKADETPASPSMGSAGACTHCSTAQQHTTTRVGRWPLVAGLGKWQRKARRSKGRRARARAVKRGYRSPWPPALTFLRHVSACGSGIRCQWPVAGHLKSRKKNSKANKAKPARRLAIQRRATGLCLPVRCPASCASSVLTIHPPGPRGWRHVPENTNLVSESVWTLGRGRAGQSRGSSQHQQGDSDRSRPVWERRRALS